MPQERTLLYTGHEFEVAHVRSHAHGHEWSAPYVMASQRIVFPISRAMLDPRFGNDTWLVDGLTAVSFGDAAAYRYLLKGIQDFPTAEGLAAELRDMGFSDVAFERLSLGIVAIHIARKPLEPRP